jgi:hypothetical protein
MPTRHDGLDANTCQLLDASEALAQRSAALSVDAANNSKTLQRLLRESDDLVRVNRAAHSLRGADNDGE